MRSLASRTSTTTQSHPDERRRALAQAGYLQPVEPPKPGRATIWRLVRNTGPHAPAVSRRPIVFDRNTGQVFNLETAQEVADGVE